MGQSLDTFVYYGIPLPYIDISEEELFEAIGFDSDELEKAGIALLYLSSWDYPSYAIYVEDSKKSAEWGESIPLNDLFTKTYPNQPQLLKILEAFKKAYPDEDYKDSVLGWYASGIFG